MYMPVAPAYGGSGLGGGWGDGIWLILIVLFALGGGMGFGGFGGGGNMGYDFPWLITGQNGINANTNAGFDNAALQASINGIQSSVTSGFWDIQTALCGGFAGVNAGIANGFAQAEIAENSRQMANMNQMFCVQSALQNCCCENRASVADLKYTVATEACADRAAVSSALRDVLEAQNASTQKILDAMCQDKIDAKNEKIVELQNQLNMASLRESQTAQNAFIQQGFANEVDQLYNRLSTCPVPSTPVYGRTPIFTCGGQSGCGCNGTSFYN
jgi:hypothetical protein